MLACVMAKEVLTRASANEEQEGWPFDGPGTGGAVVAVPATWACSVELCGAPRGTSSKVRGGAKGWSCGTGSWLSGGWSSRGLPVVRVGTTSQTIGCRIYDTISNPLREEANDGRLLRDLFLGGWLLAAACVAKPDGTRAREKRRVWILLKLRRQQERWQNQRDPDGITN